MDKTGVKLGHVVQIHVCRLAQIGTTRTATKNGKKTIGLMSTTKTLHVHHTFLHISFPFLHDYDVKMSKFAFYRVPKCDVIENEICEIMGFVKLF